VETAEAMSGLAVFGYASLVSRASAAQTLGRPVERIRPARLRGWSRAWTLGRDNAASEKTFARSDGSLPRYCLGLNVEQGARPTDPNGGLIELEEDELERLDLREVRYLRVDVTDAIAAPGGREPPRFDAVYAYTARPEHHHPVPPADSIIVATYPATIEAAFAELGPGELELVRSTTAPAPVEARPARRVGDRIPPGPPRDW
jgi:hypothetical protein